MLNTRSVSGNPFKVFLDKNESKAVGNFKNSRLNKKNRIFTTKHYFTDRATIVLLPKTTILFTIKTASDKVVLYTSDMQTCRKHKKADNRHPQLTAGCIM
jgi:hypothetical protein